MLRPLRSMLLPPLLPVLLLYVAPALALAGGPLQLAAPSPAAAAAPPADWAARVASGAMLYVADDENLPGWKPASVWGRQAQVGNGVLGTIVDSGVMFLSGVFNSVAIATNPVDAAPFPNGSRSHLARIPSSMAVRVAQGQVFACALDLQAGVYHRRSRVPAAVAVGGSSTRAATAVAEQRWYAHRTRKTALGRGVIIHASQSLGRRGALHS